MKTRKNLPDGSLQAPLENGERHGILRVVHPLHPARRDGQAGVRRGGRTRKDAEEVLKDRLAGVKAGKFPVLAKGKKVLFRDYAGDFIARAKDDEAGNPRKAS